MGCARTSMSASYFMRTGRRKQKYEMKVRGKAGLCLNSADRNKLCSTNPHCLWRPPVAPWKIDFLPLLAGRSWKYSKEMHTVVSKTPQFVLRQSFRLPAISVPVCIWWISLTFNSVLIFFPIGGIPPMGKKIRKKREGEFSVLPRIPHPPPSRGILDGPGGEPDGAEQDWGVQGVGGGTSYGPPSLLSVWENVCVCMYVCILFVYVNMCMYVCLCIPTGLLHSLLPLFPSLFHVRSSQHTGWHTGRDTAKSKFI